jgi:hypothetical protein
MSGKYKGVQSRILEKHNKAIYVHCLNHVLSLAINHAAEDPIIRSTTTIIQDTCNFFSQSAKRTTTLSSCCAEVLPSSKAQRMKSLCMTRWVECHSVIIRFVELYPAILATLDKVCMEGDINSSGRATTLKRASPHQPL